MSGCLESDELKEALLTSSTNPVPDNEIDEIIEQLDYKKNGVINFTDFITATIDIKKFLTPEKLEAIFNTFNIDNLEAITP